MPLGNPLREMPIGLIKKTIQNVEEELANKKYELSLLQEAYAYRRNKIVERIQKRKEIERIETLLKEAKSNDEKR